MVAISRGVEFLELRPNRCLSQYKHSNRDFFESKSAPCGQCTFSSLGAPLSELCALCLHIV